MSIKKIKIKIKIKEIISLLFILTLSSCAEKADFDHADQSSLLSNSIICPSGYIKAPADASVGVNNDFCVMKYEAKAWNDVDTDGVVDAGEIDADGCNEGGCTTDNWGIATHKPISNEEGHPWRNINITNAWNECDSLNSESGRANIDADNNLDGSYALISNPEWMAIARNIELVSTNWTDGVVSSGAGGCLKRGNVSGANPCTGGDSGYNGVGVDSGAGRADNGTAQLVLNNGEVIWDFSGNLHEWVDWDMTSTLKTITPAQKFFDISEGIQWPWREFANITENIANGDEMEPSTWQANDPSLLMANGIGGYAAGTSSSGGAANRGGNYAIDELSGIYALDISRNTSASVPSLGFRCVFRNP